MTGVSRFFRLPSSAREPVKSKLHDCHMKHVDQLVMQCNLSSACIDGSSHIKPCIIFAVKSPHKL